MDSNQITVTIAISDRNVSNMQIIRVKGDSTADSVNTYKVLLIDDSSEDMDWDKGVAFNHRYGDGVEVCAMKAMAALNKSGAFFKINPSA
jgi:hypothetical protein